MAQSAIEQIAESLTDGEKVDMGYWEASFGDAVYSAAEHDDVFAENLRLFVKGEIDSESLKAKIEQMVYDYAERNETDWLEARKAGKAEFDRDQREGR